MALEPGALDNSGNFINVDCMAKGIFDAMNQLMPLPQMPPDTLKDIEQKQRLLAIAISTGIINYLKAHDHDSFAVNVKVGSTSYIGTLDIS